MLRPSPQFTPFGPAAPEPDARSEVSPRATVRVQVPPCSVISVINPPTTKGRDVLHRVRMTETSARPSCAVCEGAGAGVSRATPSPGSLSCSCAVPDPCGEADGLGSLFGMASEEGVADTEVEVEGEAAEMDGELSMSASSWVHAAVNKPHAATAVAEAVMASVLGRRRWENTLSTLLFEAVLVVEQVTVL